MLNPKKLDIIRGNTVKLFVQAGDSGSGVKEVVFFASYKKYSLDKSDRFGYIYERLASVSEAPYEYVWDCSEIPDQDGLSLAFWCDIYDRAGNASLEAGGKVKNVVIDRNPAFSNKVFTAKKRTYKIDIDGNLGEWAGSDSIVFHNGDNTVRCMALWDNSALYLGIMVYDRNVFSRGITQYNDWDAWEDDAIEIHLDTRHFRYSIPDTGCVFAVISASGRYYSAYRNYESGKLTFLPCAETLAVCVHGTINNNSDADTGYSAEILIPFNCIGYCPKNEEIIGFDVQNSDREKPDGKTSFMTWADNETSRNNNPSEWGNLAFSAQTKGQKLFRLLIFVTVLFILSFLVFKRFIKVSEEERTKQQKLIREVMNFMDVNYKDPSLNREKIAARFNISGAYLGKYFKKYSGKSLPNYLNEIRIRAAYSLVKETNDSITDISIDTGFNTIENFLRTFRKIHGCSPGNLRKKKTR